MAFDIAERSAIGAGTEGSRGNDNVKAGVIVAHLSAPVKRGDRRPNGSAASGPRRRRKSRRQQHGSAWHWKQTDSWYYTLPSSKKRVPLFDEEVNRIKGEESRKTAQLALARVKLGRGWQPEAPPTSPDAQRGIGALFHQLLQTRQIVVEFGGMRYTLLARCKVPVS